jgi:NADH dehydrogenase
MSDVLVVGGTGFVGEAIASELDADTLGRSEEADVQANILLREDLGRLNDYDVVVNCVGLSPLREPRVPYQAIHVHGLENIASVLDDERHLVHISALGASPDQPVTYLRTKGKGEKKLRDLHDNHTILRPDVIYDASSATWRDRVLRPARFGVMPNVKKGSRPVHRNDVAQAVKHVIDEGITGSYDLYGDDTMTITDMVRIIGEKRVVTIPEPLWYPVFYVLCEARLFGLSRDQRKLYKLDLPYGSRPDWFEPRSIR